MRKSAEYMFLGQEFFTLVAPPLGIRAHETPDALGL